MTSVSATANGIKFIQNTQSEQLNQPAHSETSAKNELMNK
jgi:hypothetical protein